jgi:hypothetical protein
MSKNKNGKPSPEDKVNKAMDPEMEKLLGNVASIIDEMKTMNTASQMVEASEDEDGAGEGEGDKDKKEKALETTNPEGAPTANDDAEDTLDENQTDVTDESVSEIGKTLMSAIMAMTKKSQQPAPKKVDPLAVVSKALSDVAEAIKDVKKDQGVLSKAVEDIMGGLGIADQFKMKSEPSKEPGAPIAKSNDGGQPIVDVNAEATRLFADAMSQIIKKSEPAAPTHEMTAYEKGMLGDEGLREGVVAMKSLATANTRGRS